MKRRIFLELFAGLCVPTPNVQLDNGERVEDPLGSGVYPALTLSAAIKSGGIIEKAPTPEVKTKTTDKKSYSRRDFKLVIDAKEIADGKDAKIYLGMGAKNTGVEAAEGFAQFTDTLENAVVSGTMGANTLNWLTSNAFAKGLKIKNLRCTAENGSFYDKEILYKEHDPEALSNGIERKFLFSEPTAKDQNTKIREIGGFTGDFNGYNYLCMEIKKGEKISLIFEVEMQY